MTDRNSHVAEPFRSILNNFARVSQSGLTLPTRTEAEARAQLRADRLGTAVAGMCILCWPDGDARTYRTVALAAEDIEAGAFLSQPAIFLELSEAGTWRDAEADIQEIISEIEQNRSDDEAHVKSYRRVGL